MVIRAASILQQPKNAGLLRAAFTALNPVWAGAHGIDLEFKSQFGWQPKVLTLKLKLKPILACRHTPKTPCHLHQVKQHKYGGHQEHPPKAQNGRDAGAEQRADDVADRKSTV